MNNIQVKIGSKINKVRDKIDRMDYDKNCKALSKTCVVMSRIDENNTAYRLIGFLKESVWRDIIDG